AEVVLRVSASQAPGPRARLQRISLTMTVSSADRRLGGASTLYSAHAPQVYRRLRGPATPPPAEAMAAAITPPKALNPHLVGRALESEVVLAADETGPGHGREVSGRRLRVPTNNPWLFDHPVDHVPGMLLMEAARQSAHL